MPALDNYRHELFANHFVANGFNSVKAARAAGWEHATPAYAGGLRRKPAIEARIRELLADQMDELQVDAVAVKRQLARIAFADPRGLFDDEGNLIPVHELDDDTAATIAGIEVEVKAGRDGAPATRVVKIKRHNSLDALTFLGKHFKLIGDDNDGVNAFANALADRLNAAKRRGVNPIPPAAEDARIIEPARLASEPAPADPPEPMPLPFGLSAGLRPREALPVPPAAAMPVPTYQPAAAFRAAPPPPTEGDDDERLW